MQWNSLSEFLDMGGYALYVWPSFGLTALLVVVELLLVRSQRREVLRSLRQQFEAESNPT
jgi:heme exporter protein D